MKNRPPLAVICRALSNVSIADGGCIETNYSIGSHGYGQIGWTPTGKRRSVTQTTHRVAWYAAHGDIPAGLTVDHICRNRLCLNVDHLRLLTNSENASDNGYSRRTQCPVGHPYDDVNTYVCPKGKRRCRQCGRDGDVRRRALAA